MIPEESWRTAADWLLEAQSVLLVAHVAPDGDALGSALAIGLAVSRLPGERDVVVSFGEEPFVLPANLTRLPGLDLLRPPSEVPEAPDVVVTCDASSADRLGLLQPLADRTERLIAVDHHVSYDGFARLPLVDTALPATAVLADTLVAELGVELDADIAACLYTGLVTDTGSFRYAGTTPETHALAGRLLATGIRFDLIARRLFDDAPFGYLGLLGRALDRAVFEPAAAGGLGWAWTVVPALERRQLGLAFDLVEGIIDVVRKAEEAEVACVVKEDDAGDLRVSLRSKGCIDVSRIALSLGGGGHRYAAGFTAGTDLDGVVSALREALADAPHLEV